MSSAHHCCRSRDIADAYASGPTACIASPKVIASIRRELAARRVLSTADARLATLSGMVAIPAVGRTGFNDGVIYPPGDVELPLARGARRPPSTTFALARTAGRLRLNCLVLLVDFADNVGTKTPDHFHRLLFDPANPNSMHSFYKDLSYGRLEVTGQVTGWIRAAQPYGYYTNGQSGTGLTYPRNTPGLLHETLQQYGATKSLAPFDVNGDGFIDGLFLVHAGKGAEAEPNPARRRDMIWSHKWTLPTPFSTDGVRAFAYFTAPEDGKLGVFAHEFGHFLGLPDLYDTSYRSQGIGDWCLMAGGSWNGGGDRPARMSAWCLATLGWVTPKNVTRRQSLTLAALEVDRSACYRLWTGGRASRDYFLIENRQKSGRDAKLPGSGLAVWHIDETQSDNTNPLAYRVALVQADGARDLELNRNQGDAGDLFPGTAGVTAVGDSGRRHPHTRKNDGTTSGVRLSRIRMKDGVVRLDVKV